MIIYLYGPDTYRSREQLRAIMEKFRRDVDPTGYNLSRINARDTNSDEIYRLFGSQPFLAPRRMILLERALENDNDDVRTMLFEAVRKGFERQDDPSEPLYVFWEESQETKPVKRAKKSATKRSSASKDASAQRITAADLHQALCKSPYAQMFERLEDNQLEHWVIEAAQARGCAIRPDAVDLLIEWVGSDLWAMDQELQKLALFTKAQEQDAIDRACVTQLVVGASDAPLWTLLNDLHQGKTAELLNELEQQLNNGSHPLEVLATLTKDNETLISVAYNAATKSLHPYVQKKMRERLRTLPASYLPMATAALVNADTKLKSTNYPPRLLLDLLSLTLLGHPSLKQ